MVVNQKVTGTASTMPGGLALGAAVSLLVTLFGSVLSAWLVARESIPESGIGYCAMVILLLAGIAGSAVAVERIKRRRMLVCMLSGGIYYACLLGMTALFFGGQYQGMGVTALMVFCGVMLVLLAGIRREGRGDYRKTKIRSR